MPAEIALVVFPFSAAVLFALAALALKRAGALGVSVWQTAFTANMVCAASYSGLWWWGGKPVEWSLLWQPGLIGLCLFAGMATQFVALNRGDVSIAVPILGLKVLIVAGLTPFLLGDTVRPLLWLSAVLSVLGVTCLSVRGGGRVKSVLPALIAGGAAALCFALFDILVQKWSPQWGLGRLLPLVFGGNALLTLACLPFYRLEAGRISAAAWPWLLLGGALVGAQSLLFVICLAVYGGAVTINIVYSARGLLSVLLIWTIGHWFGSNEHSLGPRILGFRLLGAALLLAAIVLAVVRW